MSKQRAPKIRKLDKDAHKIFSRKAGAHTSIKYDRNKIKQQFKLTVVVEY